LACPCGCGGLSRIPEAKRDDARALDAKSL
jgi:hypothetical protein